MDLVGIKTRTHGLDEREIELVKLLAAACESTENIGHDVNDVTKRVYTHGTLENLRTEIEKIK